MRFVGVLVTQVHETKMTVRLEECDNKMKMGFDENMITAGCKSAENNFKP
jgi:hypothetical protein